MLSALINFLYEILNFFIELFFCITLFLKKTLTFFFYSTLLKISNSMLIIHDFFLKIPIIQLVIMKLDLIIYKFFYSFYIVPLQTSGAVVKLTTTIINYLVFLAQVFFLVIISIWARAAGPRYRIDQLLSITWKDLFLYLSLILFLIMSISILI